MALLVSTLWDRSAYLFALLCVGPAAWESVGQYYGQAPAFNEPPSLCLIQGFFASPQPPYYLLAAALLTLWWRGLSAYPYWLAPLTLAAPPLIGAGLCPPSLLSGLVLVHPPLLFVAYGLALTLCVAHPGPARALTQGAVAAHPAHTALRASALATLLGGVWAQQELNWGGWWGWDVVEVGSLFYLAYSTSCIHRPRLLAYDRLPPLFLASFYLSLHWGFLTSVHAFTSPGASAPLTAWPWALPPFLVALWATRLPPSLGLVAHVARLYSLAVWSMVALSVCASVNFALWLTLAAHGPLVALGVLSRYATLGLCPAFLLGGSVLWARRARGQAAHLALLLAVATLALLRPLLPAATMDLAPPGALTLCQGWLTSWSPGAVTWGLSSTGGGSPSWSGLAPYSPWGGRLAPPSGGGQALAGLAWASALVPPGGAEGQLVPSFLALLGLFLMQNHARPTSTGVVR